MVVTRVWPAARRSGQGTARAESANNFFPCAGGLSRALRGSLKTHPRHQCECLPYSLHCNCDPEEHEKPRIVLLFLLLLQARKGDLTRHILEGAARYSC